MPNKRSSSSKVPFWRSFHFPTSVPIECTWRIMLHRVSKMPLGPQGRGWVGRKEREARGGAAGTAFPQEVLSRAAGEAPKRALPPRPTSPLTPCRAAFHSNYTKGLPVFATPHCIAAVWGLHRCREARPSPRPKTGHCQNRLFCTFPTNREGPERDMASESPRIAGIADSEYKSGAVGRSEG
jgi:hypothetical protein